MSIPPGLAFDGTPGLSGTIHLAGFDSGAGELYYSNWNGNVWSQAETYQPFPGIISKPDYSFKSMLSAATKPEGGILGVSWLHLFPGTEESEGQPSVRISFTDRIIPVSIPGSISPPVSPTQVPTPFVEETPTAVPSPTPQLNIQPPPTSTNPGIPPLALGAGLAAILVLLFLAGSNVLEQ